MADYYPLVAKAIAGLERNTGEGRRALYERARSALVAQLRGMSDPALTEAEITRERLSLEEAIGKVAAESASRPRDVPRAGRRGKPVAQPFDRPHRDRRGVERFSRRDRRGRSSRRCDGARSEDGA